MLPKGGDRHRDLAGEAPAEERRPALPPLSPARLRVIPWPPLRSRHSGLVGDRCGALNIQNPRIPGMAKPVALTTVRVPIRRVLDESYPVVIGTNLAETIAERLSESDLVDHEVAIITDENVRPGMAETIRAELTDLAAGFGGQACWRRGNLELPRPCAPVEQPRACRRRPLASTR